MTPGPEISLVLCTRNRCSRLRSTLGWIERLRFPLPWEVVMVDNGSTDDTWQVLSGFQGRCEGSVVLAREPVPGLARAHMRGLATSSGRLVVLIDDDCYPEPDFLLAVHTCFEEEPRLGFLGGRIVLHDPEDLRMTIQLLDERREIPPGSFVPAGLIQGANMAFRREALEEVGGFDVRLGPGTRFNCEDVDVVARVSAAGWRGAYDPRPVVRHHHGRKTPAEARALRRSYDHGRGAYYVRCLLDRRLRRESARFWLRSWRESSRARTRRELVGAARYLLSLAWPAPRPPVHDDIRVVPGEVLTASRDISP